MTNQSIDLDALLKKVELARSFPDNTCADSRHLQIIAETLAAGQQYAMLQDEPIHCAESMLSALESLWNARSEIIRMARENKRLKKLFNEPILKSEWQELQQELTTLRAANLAAQALIDEARAETASVRQQLEDIEMSRDGYLLHSLKVEGELSDARSTITTLRAQQDKNP